MNEHRGRFAVGGLGEAPESLSVSGGEQDCGPGAESGSDVPPQTSEVQPGEMSEAQRRAIRRMDIRFADEMDVDMTRVLDRNDYWNDWA